MLNKILMTGLFSSIAAFSVLPTRKLPPLPQPIAGQFVGSIDNTIVVAGGSYWKAPDRPSETGATKVWEASVLALTPGEHNWRVIARLPQPLAYGGSVSLKNKVVFAGGQNESAFSGQVWALEQHKGHYVLKQWPPLPTPLENFSMAAAGNLIYIFGGQRSSDSIANAELWSLAVDSDGNPIGQWMERPPLPGKSRILASAAGYSGELYIASGATLVKSPDGSLVRHYLQDAWSYSPATGWRQLPDLPRPAAAAPAVCDSAGLLVLGGDDRRVAGGRSGSIPQYPGFSRTVLRYDVAGKQWLTAGELPLGLVTTGAAVLTNGNVVIPGGEDRPGSRSGEVFQFRISQ